MSYGNWRDDPSYSVRDPNRTPHSALCPEKQKRLPPLAPQPPVGFCQWCLNEVLYPEGHKLAGQRHKLRRWHKECFAEFDIARSSGAARRFIFKRDKGVCAGCSKDCIYDDWFCDHIKPIWSAPKPLPIDRRDEFYGGGNLQTLCPDCHKAKTSREAADRSAHKKGIAI